MSINVNDSITLTDSVTMQLNPIMLNVGESFTLSESVPVRFALMGSVSDSITLSESLTTAPICLAAKGIDTTIVLEGITVRPNKLLVSVSESIFLSEN